MNIIENGDLVFDTKLHAGSDSLLLNDMAITARIVDESGSNGLVECYNWLRGATRKNADLLPVSLPVGHLALRSYLETTAQSYLNANGIPIDEGWSAELSALKHGGNLVVLTPEYAGLVFFSFVDQKTDLDETQTAEGMNDYNHAYEIADEDKIFDTLEEEKEFDAMVLADHLENKARLHHYTHRAVQKILDFYGIVTMLGENS